MKLLTETLSDLKIFARKQYSLTKNVPVIVLLLSEEEHKKLKGAYYHTIQANSEASVDSKEKGTIQHSEEFFSNVAEIFELFHSYSKEEKPVITPLLREAFAIPHFGKYKYAILIREAKLFEWGSNMDIQVNGVQATGSIRKQLIYYRVLTHEFLHIVEKERGIRIFTRNDKADSEVVCSAIKAIKVLRNTHIFSD